MQANPVDQIRANIAFTDYFAQITNNLYCDFIPEGSLKQLTLLLYRVLLLPAAVKSLVKLILIIL